MKKLFLLFFLLGLMNSASAQYFQWAKSQEQSNDGTSLAAGHNFLAATGNFYNTITIGNQTFHSPISPYDSLNSYLAAYDLSGNVLWARQIINHTWRRNQITVDPEQNILVSGVFHDSLYIGSLLFKGTVPNGEAAFVAKFSATGNLLWAQSSAISTSTLADQTSVTTDAGGNVYLCGNFSGNISFDSNSFAAPNANKVYLVKYDPNGVLQWARTPGTGMQEIAACVRTAGNGDVYLATETQISPNTTYGMVVAKYNPAGTPLWSKTVSGLAHDLDLSLAVDNADNAYLCGRYSTTMAFTNSSTNLTLSSGGSNRIFLAKLSPAGTWKWAKNMASGNYSASSARLYYSPANLLGIAGTYSGSAQFTTAPLGALPSGTQNSFVARFDTAGTAIWANNVNNHNFNTGLTGDQYGNFYLSGQFSTQANFSGNILNSTTWASYMAKVINGSNALSGTVFLDLNNNGIQDATETGAPNLILASQPGPKYAITGTDGQYSLYLPDGNYTVSIPKAPRYYTFTPASHTGTLNGLNQTVTGKDFALQAIPNSNDVSVTVTNKTAARPGFALQYQLTYTNAGTTTLSDTLTFRLNQPGLTFTAATVAPASNQNGILKWYYQNLQPQETRQINVNFQVAPTMVLGTNLTAFAAIKPFSVDLFAADNYDTVSVRVTGSFDPNDKQVDKPFISTAAAAAGTYLDYTIRFQNTGTDTAFTVVVSDKLSSKLNLADFEMIAASHPYTLSLNDNNILEWRFNNILLPDSNRNEAASHGFVRFRIKSKPGLTTTDSITNNAAIYFDYNAPVITNFAVTRVSNPLGFEEAKTDLKSFNLYPNPASNYVTVEANVAKSGTAEISLLNTIGQTLQKVSLPAANTIRYELPLENLPKGIYLVKLETETVMQTKRLVIQ